MTDRSVALCLTVLNEAESVDELFASIAGQTRPPDRIVVVDGGSTDGTVERIEGWRERGLPITLLVCSGANISTGRNRAIAQADTDLIAVTDAGVRLDEGWLAQLLDPFERADRPDVVAGFFAALPDPGSPFQIALGATTLPELADIRPETFLPSSRSVAFTRAAWERVRGYPEWLDYCEDLVFDLALKAAGFRFAWTPRARVYFRPRPTPRAFFVQYYRYARGDGKADLWRRRHTVRYATYLGLPIALWLVRRHRWMLAPLGLAATGYVRRPYERALGTGTTLPLGGRVAMFAWVPVIRLIGDCAKMLGYPVGVAWRWRRSTALTQRSSATSTLSQRGRE
ncbi:MAG: glycosyltransferase [Chloroflexi bacterium]|nr:glycosyltransferase [Chloroflexota bacterium]